ncbi:MAG: hypothetical protein HQK65_18095, partial [Desulfamplus sp.]|nr:hypothetical protein [Desulfamplus sp.]
MAQIKLHDTLLPFTCNTPQCKKEYDLSLFTEVSLLWGFIYLVSEDDEEAVIGLTCPYCYKTTIRKCLADVAVLLHAKIQKQIKVTTDIYYQLNNSAYYSPEILKELGLIKHKYNINITNGEKQFIIPQNINSQQHKAITESSLPSLCDIENTHRFKAIPRIIIYYNKLECILSGEEDYKLNECILNLIKHNNTHWNDNPSVQFKHMITNDLTEEEYHELYLQNMAFDTKQFKDNIGDFISTTRIMRNCIDYEIISRNSIVNRYARKIYTLSEIEKSEMDAHYYPDSYYCDQYNETNFYDIPGQAEETLPIQKHIQNKTAEPAADQPSNYDAFLNEQNTKV